MNSGAIDRLNQGVEEYNLAAFVASILVALVFAFVWSLIIAAILRAVAKWLIKEDVKYGNAFVTALLSMLISIVIGRVGEALIGTETAGTVFKNLMFPIAFLIQSWITSSRLKTCFGTACLISLVIVGVLIGITIIVGGIWFLVIQFRS